MNKLLGMILFLCAFTAYAEESVMTLEEGGNSQMSLEIAKESNVQNPAWRFQIGMSKADLGKTRTDRQGSGLTVGLAYDFNNLIAVGGSYTNLKVEQTMNGYDSGSYQYTYDSDVAMGYAEVTPIRYNIGKVAFAGSFLVGIMTNPFSQYRNDSSGFYGGALVLSLNKQVGISLDTKVSKDMRSMNQLSLVGYY